MSVAALVVVPRDPEREALIDALVADVAGGIAVLNDARDGVGSFNIPDELIWERARGIVCGLLLAYDVRGLA